MTCLFTLSYQAKRVGYTNHWGQDPFWGIPAGPTFNCDREFRADQELNIKAYILHNLRSERQTLVVGDGNMAFRLYMWQVGLDEVAFPDFRSMVGDKIGYGFSTLGSVREERPFDKPVQLAGSASSVTSVAGDPTSYRPSPALVRPLSCGVANPDGFANPWFRSGLDPHAMRSAQESVLDPSEWASVTDAPGDLEEGQETPPMPPAASGPATSSAGSWEEVGIGAKVNLVQPQFRGRRGGTYIRL